MATIKEQLIMDATQYQREMKKAKDSVDSLKKGKEMLAGASTNEAGSLFTMLINHSSVKVVSGVALNRLQNRVRWTLKTLRSWADGLCIG